MLRTVVPARPSSSASVGRDPARAPTGFSAAPVQTGEHPGDGGVKALGPHASLGSTALSCGRPSPWDGTGSLTPLPNGQHWVRGAAGRAPACGGGPGPGTSGDSHGTPHPGPVLPRQPAQASAGMPMKKERGAGVLLQAGAPGAGGLLWAPGSSWRGDEESAPRSNEGDEDGPWGGSAPRGDAGAHGRREGGAGRRGQGCWQEGSGCRQAGVYLPSLWRTGSDPCCPPATSCPSLCQG